LWVPEIEKYRLRVALSQCIAHSGFGFFDGGCRIFAEAARRLFAGSRIVTIVHGRSLRPDHYGLLIGENLVLDGDGFYPSPQSWVQSFQEKETTWGRKLQVVLDYIDSEEIPRNPSLSKKIARILSP
jgi:hypothetical protein